MRKHLLAKAHIAKLKELSESEVSEFTSTTVDETALAILERQSSRGIKVVNSQRTFIFISYILSILMQLVDRTIQTGCKGLPNCQISQRQLESLPDVGMYFGSHSMKH